MFRRQDRQAAHLHLVVFIDLVLNYQHVPRLLQFIDSLSMLCLQFPDHLFQIYHQIKKKVPKHYLIIISSPADSSLAKYSQPTISPDSPWNSIKSVKFSAVNLVISFIQFSAIQFNINKCT